MKPRPRDFVGPGLLALALAALVILLVAGNIPHAAT
jgi:hypothetical protein